MTVNLDISVEDAFNYIVKSIRNPISNEYSNYGYDIYLPNIMMSYAQIKTGDCNYTDQYLPQLSPYFYSAAWDLCRRGILRPGVTKHGAQSTLDGNAGNGYSITPFGRTWFSESGKDDYVPTEPERFARILDSTGARFGSGFRQRAQEAIRCYGAHAYLACCAMCGAAAESIILAIAIAKTKDEESILKDYLSAGGRKKIENTIIGQKKEQIQNEFRSFNGLLGYWRDSASHGQEVSISDDEAFTSLAILLRFCHFSVNHWDELIS